MVPTVVLILMQCYWIIASLGFLDFELFDMDLDLELEGAETSGLLNGLAMFINFGEVPFTLVLSIISLNFWIIMMLTYYLPIEAGGLISGILLLPAFVLSLFATRYEVQPLRNKYLKRVSHNNIEHRVFYKRCKLKSDLGYGRIGLAEIQQDGTSIVINVQVQFENESFKKDEYALVSKKDDEKNVYYISKLLMGSEFYKELEDF